MKTSFGRFFYAMEVYRYLITMNLSTLNVIILTTFIVSLAVFFQKPVSLYLKLFPFYFFISFFVEWEMEYLGNHGKYNTGLGNSWAVIEFNFYFFVLREILSGIKIRRIILFMMIFYTSFSLLMLYLQKKVEFNPVNFTFGCLLAVVLCIYYFIELFQETEVRSLSRLPAFWIATAILFTNVCTFPMFALISFMKEVPGIIYNHLSTILIIISVLTSLLYSIGFLCRIKIRKSTL
jgi:hypothetical protein